MLLAIPAPTELSVWTYCAVKLILSALAALLAVTFFSTGQVPAHCCCRS